MSPAKGKAAAGLPHSKTGVYPSIIILEFNTRILRKVKENFQGISGRWRGWQELVGS
jgi:hypothetical protein